MENKQKILVFHHSGAIGGGGVSMLHILQAMQECDYEIKVICPDEPKHMQNEIHKLDIKAIGTFDKDWVLPHFNGQYYNILDPRYLKRLRHIKKSKNVVRQLIQHENPDIVVFNSMMIAWMVDCVTEGIKTICFDRETFPHYGRGMRNNRIKKQLKRMTQSVYLSEYDKKQAGDHDNAIVITDKVDIAAFRTDIADINAKCTRQLDFDKRCILYMGGMWRVKGAHVALQMMHHLDDSYELVFMQYTPDHHLTKATTLKAKIKRWLWLDYEHLAIQHLTGIEGRVKFFKAQKDMTPFYSACDIVIFPSTKPHQARPVYEAGASCKPCIITDFPNTQEHALHDVNVLTFKAGDAKALAACVEKLCDGELYYKLADNGHQMCVKHHNIDDLKKEIKSMLESVGV